MVRDHLDDEVLIGGGHPSVFHHPPARHHMKSIAQAAIICHAEREPEPYPDKEHHDHARVYCRLIRFHSYECESSSSPTSQPVLSAIQYPSRIQDLHECRPSLHLAARGSKDATYDARYDPCSRHKGERKRKERYEHSLEQRYMFECSALAHDSLTRDEWARVIVGTGKQDGQGEERDRRKAHERSYGESALHRSRVIRAVGIATQAS